MSNQSGINASDDLKRFLASSRDGSIRCIKVTIHEHQDQHPVLELDSDFPTKGTWEDDWEKTVPPCVNMDFPCFILYRLDEKDGSGNYMWILISWSPDIAHTRLKMLYASTKATFKKEFGGGQLKEEYYANMKEEVTLSGYKRHLKSEAAPGPLSREEEEMLEIKQTETRVDVSVDSKQAMANLQFPFEKNALTAIESYWKKGHDYIQLGIDLEEEIIVLKSKDNVDITTLPSKVPTECARYHLFRYKHNYEGDSLESNVFIYSMPGYSVSIKERMLYSSCKNSVVDVLERIYSIPVDKKVEVDSGEELTEEFIMGELHPIKNLHKPKFSKPAPPSRGARRLTKAPKS